jgi:hypothetical protein
MESERMMRLDWAKAMALDSGLAKVLVSALKMVSELESGSA